MYAAENGNVEVVKTLLAHGTGVNARGKDGACALKWAVKGKYKAVEEVLKKAGAKAQSAE